MPYPVTRKAFRVVKKRGKTTITTLSPYKYELQETIKKKTYRKRKTKVEENKILRRNFFSI